MAKSEYNTEEIAEITHDEAARSTQPGTTGIASKERVLDLEYLNDKSHNKKLRRRIDWRVLPLLSFLYLLNYLDRGNVGNAKVLNEEDGDSLLQQTNMTSGGYAIAVTLFSVAYTLFEVPSNWIMKHYVRPSLWLAVLLFCWGVLTLGFSGVRTYAEVVVIRFMIGIFEAGFFPGIIYYTTFWYRIEERASRISFVAAHANLAGAFGGTIAYGVGHMNGTNGLQGFRWLFIIEGIITIICVPLLIFTLPDYPSSAKWLSEEDKKFGEERLQILDSIPLASFTFYTATIITGLGYESLEAQLLTIPPWVVGYLVALGLSFSADHFNARGYHIAFASTVGGLGWLIAGCLPAHAYAARYGCLVLAAVGAFPCVPSLSAWVTGNVPSFATMAIATALNNSAAGISQIIAQWIWIPGQADAGYPTGNFTCAACSFTVAVGAILLRLLYGRMNKNDVLDVTGNRRVWAL
ncbi:Major facilitator superfamily domain, general substrate transporter [Niveomyces insectorum RCEF 264]|uniref:Major facilitator superfamily domain, general substrate transporter n=1 Tax=Niveomyces insectorum RCEF 264 TaxID=1081102 RepID=A0A167N7C8_9HYPO|nr:Major facilitator superfamily domain, general substrate transporter [Niveomyces insectorum RCEF 264]